MDNPCMHMCWWLFSIAALSHMTMEHVRNLFVEQDGEHGSRKVTGTLTVYHLFVRDTPSHQSQSCMCNAHTILWPSTIYFIFCPSSLQFFLSLFQTFDFYSLPSINLDFVAWPICCTSPSTCLPASQTLSQGSFSGKLCTHVHAWCCVAVCGMYDVCVSVKMCVAKI